MNMRFSFQPKTFTKSIRNKKKTNYIKTLGICIRGHTFMTSTKKWLIFWRPVPPSEKTNRSIQKKKKKKKPQKKKKRIRKHLTNFKPPPPPSPLPCERHKYMKQYLVTIKKKTINNTHYGKLFTNFFFYAF